MTEIFTDISEDIKNYADFTWTLAMSKNSLDEAVEILNNFTNFYRTFGTPKEVEFLQFYFNMRMEMMKK
jgi:hypothetical protein